MHTVTVRLPAAEFSAAMAAMREWLDHKHYEPALFKYEQEDEAVKIPPTPPQLEFVALPLNEP